MKNITAETIEDLLTQAARASRKRVNLNLHKEPSDPINRFLNAGISGTYIQPHRHRVGKWELLSLIQGHLDVVLFEDNGRIKRRMTLDSRISNLIEIPGGEWHSFVFCSPGAVVLEVKPGPYEPDLDKEFATWAPREGESASASFLAWLERATSGETWPRQMRIAAPKG
jgi:cupin fold WbuC family metalloprotein